MLSFNKGAGRLIPAGITMAAAAVSMSIAVFADDVSDAATALTNANFSTNLDIDIDDITDAAGLRAAIANAALAVPDVSAFGVDIAASVTFGTCSYSGDLHADFASTKYTLTITKASNTTDDTSFGAVSFASNWHSTIQNTLDDYADSIKNDTTAVNVYGVNTEALLKTALETWAENAIGNPSGVTVTAAVNLNNNNPADTAATFTGASVVFTITHTGGRTATANVSSFTVSRKIPFAGTIDVTGTLKAGNELTAAVTGTPAGAGVPTYEWKLDGSVVSGATTAKYTPTAAGTVIVTVTYPATATVEGGTLTKTVTVTAADVTPEPETSSSGGGRASRATSLDSNGNPETSAPAVTTEPSAAANEPSGGTGTGGNTDTNATDGEDLEDGFGGGDDGPGGDGGNSGIDSGAGNGGGNNINASGNGNPNTGMAAGVGVAALAAAGLLTAITVKRRK